MTDADRPKTPAERVALAIQRSGKTLEQLAEALGCTHAMLSQWQTGGTNVANAKADLLYRFAEQTGTDVRWILTGRGPVISRYMLSSEMNRISTAIKAMEQREPRLVEHVVRMVEAAAGQAPTTQGSPAPSVESAGSRPTKAVLS